MKVKENIIAIVGGGANGVATFVHLVLKLITDPVKPPVSILLLEKEDEIGPGLAYGTYQPGHLLNTSAGLMGIFAEEPMHFVEWMQENRVRVEKQYPGVAIHPDAYIPRRLYGEYLKAVLHEYAVLAMQHSLPVKLLNDEAIDAEVSNEKVVLHLASGNNIEAAVAILATGTPKPGNFMHLEKSRNYFDFPWPGKRLLEHIPQEAPVSIVGTSLTAIDTLITFMDNKHTGKLTLYSRNGLLPRVQTPFDVPFKREILTLENIRKTVREKKRPLRAKDLFRLFQAEAERIMGKQANWKKFNRVGKPHLELLKHDMEVALKGESEFQNILYSTRYLSFPAWKLLPEDEKLLFAKWFGAHWDINRHCIPPENARKLIQLLESGQLTIKDGSDKVEWNEEEAVFYFHLKDGSTDRATYVVNATGTARDVEKMDIPILQQLLKKNMIVPYKPGGVRCNTHTSQLYIPDFPQAPLYGTGQLLSGELFDTNSVWFNVSCIDRMTNDITRRIAYGHIG